MNAQTQLSLAGHGFRVSVHRTLHTSYDRERSNERRRTKRKVPRINVKKNAEEVTRL